MIRPLLFVVFFLHKFLLAEHLFAQRPDPKRLTAWVDSVHKIKTDTGAIWIYGDQTIYRWKKKLAKVYDVPVIAVGHPSLTLYDINYHFKALLASKFPSVVYVHCGNNELLAGVAIDTILRDFKVLLRHAYRQMPGVQVVYLAPQPAPAYKKWFDKQKNLRDKMAELCIQYPNSSFFDPTHFMLNEKNRLLPLHFKADSLTLSEGGYALWEAELKKNLYSLIPLEEED